MKQSENFIYVQAVANSSDSQGKYINWNFTHDLKY